MNFRNASTSTIGRRIYGVPCSPLLSKPVAIGRIAHGGRRSSWTCSSRKTTVLEFPFSPVFK